MELAWPLGSRLLHVRHRWRRVRPVEEDVEVRRTGRRSDFGKGIDKAGTPSGDTNKHVGHLSWSEMHKTSGKAEDDEQTSLETMKW
jgi:hypothetical protein